MRCLEMNKWEKDEKKFRGGDVDIGGGNEGWECVRKM